MKSVHAQVGQLLDDYSLKYYLPGSPVRSRICWGVEIQVAKNLISVRQPVQRELRQLL